MWVKFDKILWKIRESDSISALNPDKWFFATELALITAFPTGSDWDFAIVWATDTIWVWDSDTSAWVDTATPAQDISWKLNVAYASQTLTWAWPFVVTLVPNTINTIAMPSWTFSWTLTFTWHVVWTMLRIRFAWPTNSQVWLGGANIIPKQTMAWNYTYIWTGSIWSQISATNKILNDIASDLNVQIYKKTLTITSAEILNFNTEPVEIIPAPWVWKSIYINSIVWKLVFNTTSYWWANNLLLKCWSAEIGTVTGLLWIPWPITTTATPYQTNFMPIEENTAVYVSNSAFPDSNPTLGDSDIIAQVTYSIINS